MTDSEEMLKKIPDGELRKFAESSILQSAQRVIVELATGPIDENLFESLTRKGDRLPQIKPNVKRINKPNPGHGTLRDLETQIKKRGIEIATVIPIADAISVDVTPTQLRDIISSPLVGVVRPNRTHKIKLRKIR